jgi:hypothetical protein
MSEPKHLPFFNSVARAVSVATAQFNKIAPLPFEKLPNDLKFKFLRNGMHGLGLRPKKEAAALYNSIPISLRQDGSDAIRKFLQGKDFSHIKPHHQGGSGASNNIVFENAGTNRARGGKEMTEPELRGVNGINYAAGFKFVISNANRIGLKTGALAVTFGAITIIPKQVKRYQRGEVDAKQAIWDGTKQLALQGGKGYLVGFGSHIATTGLVWFGVGTLAASFAVPIGLIAAGTFLAWKQSQSKPSSHSINIPSIKALTTRNHYKADGILVCVPQIL